MQRLLQNVRTLPVATTVLVRSAGGSSPHQCTRSESSEYHLRFVIPDLLTPARPSSRLWSRPMKCCP